ncbi:MAG: HAMP domain-containing sensor histidine kinase, partial [Syntrophales bacterium]|nr:HAMP domain-containing sensor histidine kinase [Syntrophales bacterium]
MKINDIYNEVFKFRILPKLLIYFLALSIVPLIILGYFANKNLNDTGMQAAKRAGDMGKVNLLSAEDIGRTAIEDSVRALDSKSTEAIELRTVELAMRIADFLYERDHDILMLASFKPSPYSYLNVYRTLKKDIIVADEKPVDRTRKHNVLPTNLENKESWRHRPPNHFHTVSKPLYKEITFIDLQGQEQIKISGGRISGDLVDISRKDNTYCRAEDYFHHLNRLKKGEIYVSRVIGPYVAGWLHNTPAGTKLKPGSAFAGKENPRGRKFEAIIRWATPIYEEDKKIGYLTMALDHTHVMEFTDHVIPTEERFTALSDGGSGNYAFIWDYQDRCISHARDFFICGYDPLTGREVPGWISQDIYEKYRQSGLSLENFVRLRPPFLDFSQRKKGAIEQIKSGEIPLDCRVLDMAPQCQGWHEGTEDGGSGSFLILWSGLWKLTTYAAIPYRTGMYGQLKRGFGYVTIGANVDDFHKDANVTKAKIEKSIFNQENQIVTMNAKTRILIDESSDRNRRMVMIITITAGLGVILASIFISIGITRPLRRLTEGAVSMSKGKYDQFMNIKSQDEVGELAKAFNEMTKVVSEVDKMKSEFVTTASHELRTPIQAMLLGVSGVLEGYSGTIDEEVREDLELSRDGIERLMRLVTNLLDLSRLEAHKFTLNRQHAPVSEIVDRAIAEVSDLANAHSHIIIKEYQSEPMEMNLDKDRMVQVVINLLSNSIKYSPDGGKILVKAVKADGGLIISVADNGYGVPQWAKEEIFKKFFQADNIMSHRVGGSGLGLSITKGIVEMHG